MYIIKTSTTSVLDIRITDKGRELLTKGLKEQDTFDILKFAFGDSEIDYESLDRMLDLSSDLTTFSPNICYPQTTAIEINTKLYCAGTVPSGTPNLTLSKSSLILEKNTEESVSVETKWSPVIGSYLENYKWINLGPMGDWEYIIDVSPNSRTAIIRAINIAGSTKIKILGQTSGKYTILNLTIN